MEDIEIDRTNKITEGETTPYFSNPIPMVGDLVRIEIKEVTEVEFKATSSHYPDREFSIMFRDASKGARKADLQKIGLGKELVARVTINDIRTNITSLTLINIDTY
jgi:hypothetical protein